MLQCRYASCKLYNHLHNSRPVASLLVHFIIASAFTGCQAKESAYSLDGNGYSEGSQKYHHPHYFVNAEGVLPFVRGLDLTRNDFKVAFSFCFNFSMENFNL